MAGRAGSNPVWRPINAASTAEMVTGFLQQCEQPFRHADTRSMGLAHAEAARCNHRTRCGAEDAACAARTSLPAFLLGRRDCTLRVALSTETGRRSRTCTGTWALSTAVGLIGTRKRTRGQATGATMSVPDAPRSGRPFRNGAGPKASIVVSVSAQKTIGPHVRSDLCPT